MPPKKGYRQTPEHRAAIGEANRRAYADPERKAAISEKFRALWQDPEYRARWIAQRNARPVQTDEERKAYRHAYYERNKEVIKARARAHYYADLEASRTAGREYARRNREAANKRLRKWMENPENRAKAYARSQAYMKAHPDLRHMHYARRRALKVSQFVEYVDRRVVLANFQGRCGWCSEPVDPADFHVDHIIALVHGGEHSYANTQPVHPACNYEKRTVLKERAA